MDSVETVVTHSGADMSIWGLFMAADPLVKLVMLVLLAASVCCWAIVVDKVAAIRRERRQATEFEDSFWSGGSLDELYDQTGGDPDDAMKLILEKLKKLGIEQNLSQIPYDEGFLSTIESGLKEIAEESSNHLESIGAIIPCIMGQYTGLFGEMNQ